MAMTATFDILSCAKRFKAAGFTDNQAEEVVAALRDVRDSRLEEMATKSDIKEAKSELETRIAEAKEPSKNNLNILLVFWSARVVAKRLTY